ncbi:hypothetical protein MRX96_038117 [Rhipicephalus microplus]
MTTAIAVLTPPPKPPRTPGGTTAHTSWNGHSVSFSSLCSRIRDGRGPPTSPALRREVEVLPGPNFPLQLPPVHPDPTTDHEPRRDDVRLDVNGAD